MRDSSGGIQWQHCISLYPCTPAWTLVSRYQSCSFIVLSAPVLLSCLHRKKKIKKEKEHIHGDHEAIVGNSVTPTALHGCCTPATCQQGSRTLFLSCCITISHFSHSPSQSSQSTLLARSVRSREARCPRKATRAFWSPLSTPSISIDCTPRMFSHITEACARPSSGRCRLHM